MPTAKHYYECHITIEPVFEIKLAQVELIATFENFKVAKLLMQKREHDVPKLSKFDTFMTAHDKVYGQLLQRMEWTIVELKANGFKVLRYKIEDIVLDSRIKDELELL